MLIATPSPKVLRRLVELKNLAGADLAGVVRPRLALTSAAMVVGAALGPRLFRTFGSVAVVGACGALIACVGIAGAISRDPLPTPL